MRLAADANVLLAAVLGGRAGLVLTHPKIEHVLTTEANLAEVEEYALLLAQKKRLRGDLVLLAVASLPITVMEPADYSKSLPEAMRRIGRRDPDDADLLALALHHKIPIWSNDRDFEKLRVELFTTEDLLRHLGIIK
ncbi:MAG TPA: PIN domain-containing protein [Candidatus Udaeobacter sp.]|nr:PIN domain-containing protein [Candidatus Udaeobacter sp.]